MAIKDLRKGGSSIMDFLHRNASNQPHTRPVAPNINNAATPGSSNMGGVTNDGHFGLFNQPKWLRVASVTLLFSVTALVVGVVALLNRGNFTAESDFVNKDDYQAIFLNTDQVYFGHVVDLNNKYVNLMDVYYLSAQQASDSKQTNLELRKLGCEVHGPKDQLIINREQVTFWENIKSDSTVVKGIKELQQKNKDGLQCPAPQSETSQQSPQQATSTENKKN